jgi:hypothetical protein
MNSKIAKKLRQIARRHVRKELEGFQILPLRGRLKIAWRIIFKC